MSDFIVTYDKANKYEFKVLFNGPKGSLYQGGTWDINVILPESYPYKSPSIVFI